MKILFGRRSIFCRISAALVLNNCVQPTYLSNCYYYWSDYNNTFIIAETVSSLKHVNFFGIISELTCSSLDLLSICARLSAPFNRSGFRTGGPNGGRDTRQKWPRPRRSTTQRPRRWRRARITKTTTSTTNHWTQTQTTRKSRDCWKSTRPPTWRWSAPAVTARTLCDAHSWGPTCVWGGSNRLVALFWPPFHMTFQHAPDRIAFCSHGARKCVKTEDARKMHWPNRDQRRILAASKPTYRQCVHGDMPCQDRTRRRLVVASSCQLKGQKHWNRKLFWRHKVRF